MLPVGLNVPADCALAIVAFPKDTARTTSAIRATRGTATRIIFFTSSARPPHLAEHGTGPVSPPVPVIELLTGRDLPRDVNDDGVALPALYQLLLAQIAKQELFDELDAAILHELRVRL